MQQGDCSHTGKGGNEQVVTKFDEEKCNLCPKFDTYHEDIDDFLLQEDLRMIETLFKSINHLKGEELMEVWKNGEGKPQIHKSHEKVKHESLKSNCVGFVDFGANIDDTNLIQEMLNFEQKSNDFFCEDMEQLQVEISALEHAIHNEEVNNFLDKGKSNRNEIGESQEVETMKKGLHMIEELYEGLNKNENILDQLGNEAMQEQNRDDKTKLDL
ncbi:hypothetical protein KI387_014776, partial [Taxus chinensis]